jgi:hypothetical protein
LQFPLPLDKSAMVTNPTNSGMWTHFMRAACLFGLVLAASSCERNPGLQSPNSPGSPDSPSPAPAPLNLSGTWTGSLTDNGTTTNNATLRLTHTNDNVTGSISWTGATTAAGNVTGTVSGRTFTFKIVIPVGGFTNPPSTRFCLASLTGTASDVSSEQISADYTGTNTCSGLVPFPGALRLDRN